MMTIERDHIVKQLLYSPDTLGKTPVDDGIARLRREIEEQWNGEMQPPTQYGLKEAWEIVSSAERMDVAFAVRTNLTFNGFHDDDCPIHGKAVTFRARDCLHVKAKYNEDWWIGRVVKVDSPIGFIPAPAKIKKLAEEIASQQRDSLLRKQPAKEEKKAAAVAAAAAVKAASDDNKKATSLDSLCVEAIPQSRVSEVDGKAQGPYEAVPVIRPIVLCGPSMRGFEITDLMHKALLHAIKKQFEEKLEVYQVDEKSLKLLNSSISANKSGSSTAPEGLDVITDRIYEVARSFRLLFVDLKINSPTPLKNSALNPILVHIKISNTKVLQNLIKQRGTDQKRGMTAQVYTATKLCDLDKRHFDVILNEHNFTEAAQHLNNYLEKYWKASRPYQPSRKHHDSILRNAPGIISKLGLKSPRPSYAGGRRSEQRMRA